MLKHLQSRDGDRTMWERGFTLVELLVVIVILGILAAVVVFAVGGSTRDAAVNACLAERSTVESAVEAWVAVADSHPGNPAQPSTTNLTTGFSDDTPPKPFLRHSPHYWDVAGGALTRHQQTNPGLDKCDTNT